MMKMMTRCFVGVSFFALTACGVHQPYPFGIIGKPDISVGVSPVQDKTEVTDFSYIHSMDVNILDEKQAIQRELKQVRLGVDAWLQKEVTTQNFTSMHRIPYSFQTLPQASNSYDHSDDLILAIDITEYGHIRRKWILFMAGTGLVEGIVQGVVISQATGSPAVGIAVGAEEIASESLTWLAGSWVWDKFLAPVMIKGQMWRVSDGKLIWKDLEFADSSDVWDIMFSDKIVKKEDALKLSLKQAGENLFKDLSTYIKQQILNPRKAHR